MKQISYLIFAIVLTSMASAQHSISDIVAAVESLNATLSAEQIDTMSYDLDSDVRVNWSNLPAGMYKNRNGIRMGDLSDEQRAAVFAVLEASTSEAGYTEIIETVRADEILASSNMAERMGWTEDNYFFALFGEPSTTDTWAWQFGGHHLAVNMTLQGDEIVLSPTLLAIEPATYDDAGTTYTPMADHLDAAFAVVNALDEETLTASMVSNRPEELYAGAGGDGVIPALEGSIVGEWTAEQQALLLELINEWVGIMPEAEAAEQLDEIASAFDSTYFAWNGPTDGSGSIYFRVQNNDLILELSTQGNLGADAGHYHSIYRNPNNEYGVALE